MLTIQRILRGGNSAEQKPNTKRKPAHVIFLQGSRALFLHNSQPLAKKGKLSTWAWYWLTLTLTYLPNTRIKWRLAERVLRRNRRNCELPVIEKILRPLHAISTVCRCTDLTQKSPEQPKRYRKIPTLGNDLMADPSRNPLYDNESILAKVAFGFTQNLPKPHETCPSFGGCSEEVQQHQSMALLILV